MSSLCNKVTFMKEGNQTSRDNENGMFASEDPARSEERETLMVSGSANALITCKVEMG